MAKLITIIAELLRAALLFVFVMPCVYLLAAYTSMRKIERFCIGRNEYSVED